MRLIAILIVLLFAAPVVAENGAILTVSGTGTATTAPDIGVVTLGVRKSAANASTAMTAVSAALDDVLQLIRAGGVAELDIQTTGLSLSPRYAPPRDSEAGPRVVGFQASNAVTLTIRDLDALGPLLGQVVAQGANTLNGLTFDVSDAGPLQSEAERRAVADAARTATVLADAAGLKLGPIVSIVEGVASGQGGPILRSFSAAESAAVPIAGGAVSRTATVTLTYRLVP